MEMLEWNMCTARYTKSQDNRRIITSMKWTEWREHKRDREQEWREERKNKNIEEQNHE